MLLYNIITSYQTRPLSGKKIMIRTKAVVFYIFTYWFTICGCLLSFLLLNFYLVSFPFKLNNIILHFLCWFADMDVLSAFIYLSSFHLHFEECFYVWNLGLTFLFLFHSSKWPPFFSDDRFVFLTVVPPYAA